MSPATAIRNTSSNTAYYNVGVTNNAPDLTYGVVVGGSTGLASITSVTAGPGTCTPSAGPG